METKIKYFLLFSSSQRATFERQTYFWLCGHPYCNVRKKCARKTVQRPTSRSYFNRIKMPKNGCMVVLGHGHSHYGFGVHVNTTHNNICCIRSHKLLALSYCELRLTFPTCCALNLPVIFVLFTPIRHHLLSFELVQNEP